MRVTVFALAMAITLSACAHAEHYDVFILAGQSNMDGRANIGELTGELASWSRPQADIRFAYSDSTLRNHYLTSDGWITLAPGYSVPPSVDMKTFTLPGKTFGPELSFARTMADSMPGHHIAVIKFAEGGTSLKTDWRVGENGALYDQMLAFIARSLHQLEANGDTYQLRGFAWHQGESDSKETQAAYAAMLTHLIQQLRHDLAGYLKPPSSSLAVVVGEVFDSVRAAEKQVAKELATAAFASAAGLETQDHGTHFNAASQIELGKRMAAAMLGLLPPK